MTSVLPTRRAILETVTALLTTIMPKRAAGATRSIAPQKESQATNEDETASRQSNDLHCCNPTQNDAVDLSSFGFKGDGISDDTNAWRQAIAWAGTHKIRKIRVPSGLSLVESAIVDGQHPLPAGLTFVGQGAATDSPYFCQSRLIYSGSETCWNVAYTSGSPANFGRWCWKAMTFQCTHPNGSMFSFGNPLTHEPSDDPKSDPYAFILDINFEGILALGARGSGDFLRACKVFAIGIDANSSIYNFRRAFWLKGCDNSKIQCRMVGNNRGVMIERAGTFGNNNCIDIRSIWGVDVAFGNEAPYSVWDCGNKTTIGRGMLLEGKALAAHFYLNGYGTEILSPLLGAAAPLFELGPEAREVIIYSPRCTIVDNVNEPILHSPKSPNFGSPLEDYRIRIFDAPSTVQAIIPPDPRIFAIDCAGPIGRPPAAAGAQMVIGPNGLQPSSYICSALNYWATRGSPGGGGIKGFVRDPTINGRWVIHLSRDNPKEQGIFLNFLIGVDVQPGLHRLTNRSRLRSGTSNDGWSLIAIYDGALLSNNFAFASSQLFATYDGIVDISSAELGKTLSISLYNGSNGKTGEDIFVEAIGLAPMLS